MTVEAANQVGAFMAILGVFSTIILVGVRLQVRGASDANQKRDQRLIEHIDSKFGEINQRMDQHQNRLDAHDTEITRQHTANLELRNEMLESMRDKYVRHDDIAEMRRQIGAIFQKIDNLTFREVQQKEHHR